MRSAASFVVACTVLIAVAVRATGATGDLLISYESELGTLPFQQGWTCEGGCLRTDCPTDPIPPYPVGECWFQGQNGNTCTLGYGCGPAASGGTRVEQFNAPSEPLGVQDACSYTEWLAFDDGEDFLDVPFPVALPNRNLTFGPGDPATIWGPHAHPAFGAPGFIRAPVGYPPLRIVTGGGVPAVATLPASGSSMRNLGRIVTSRPFPVRPGSSAVTLLVKLACGNHMLTNELVQLRGFGRSFCFGVDGLAGSSTLGRFAYGTTSSKTLGMFGDRTVQVALARRNVWGPHEGEFFVVRLILNSNGTVEAWLNDDPSTLWSVTAGVGTDTRLAINTDEQAGTMWVDYVRLYEGAVLPGACGDPVFDINRDGRVDGADRLNGFDGFLDCVTGPAAPASILEALPERCACHDHNHDRTVDMIDFAAFQRCLTLMNGGVDTRCDD